MTNIVKVSISIVFSCFLAACALDIQGQVHFGEDGGDDQEIADGYDVQIDGHEDPGPVDPLPDDLARDEPDLDDPGEEDMAPCEDGLFECLPDGSARVCIDGTWSGVGTCYLGCDPAGGACYHPSNVPPGLMPELENPGLLALELAGATTPVTINSDTGGITGSDGTFIRNEGTGLVDGIYFDVVSQAEDPSHTVAVFIMQRLDIPGGMTLMGVGSNPIALLVKDGVDIAGTMDMGARQDPASTAAAMGHHLPGPGGHPGGRPGEPGLGLCPGGADGGAACGEYVTAGGGGGGFGGRGGDGGDGADPSLGCNDVYEGGAGGGPCGRPELRPLTGGSGGGGGGRPPSGASEPGPGGAGGGGLQITSLTYIHVHASGIVTAPGGGGGGGDLNGGGGGGGGAGGGILLEAAEIIMDAGSVIAANGGGGGAGDCT